MIGDFPPDLNGLRQWVSYKIEPDANGNPTKVPYDPRTGQPASSTDPATWSPLSEVMNGHAYLYQGPGFMLSEDDGISIADLDNPFRRVVGGVVQTITQEDPAAYDAALRTWASYEGVIKDFDSYTEWSPSKMGFHIWVRGKLPDDWGKRKGTFEIYGRKRFMTVTGLHLPGTPKTINPRQHQLEEFARVLGLDKANVSNFESQPETQTDIELWDKLNKSATAGKFLALWNGDITGYPSGSEADQALANYICYFTDNKEQAARVFRASPHFANRPKLQDRPKLVEYAINKGFDMKAPPIDFEAIRAMAERQRQAQTDAWATPAAEPPSYEPPPPAPAPAPPSVMQERPPGVLGDIAEYLYAAAPRPVPECALAGAIGLLAGICGRAYNVSRTGLNQYVVMIGPSGIGKESISSGLDRVLDQVKDTIPAVTMFLGPSNIQSAPGLYKMFGPQDQKGATPSFVSVIPEFGKKLKVWTDPRASSNEQMLHAAYLDLWTKSGRGQSAGGFKYSDAAKDMPKVFAPGLSIIGDTVPSRFYEACTAASIEGGLIPRMLLIEYKGDRPANNAEAAARAQMPPDAVARLKALVEVALMRNQINDPIDVKMTSAARDLFVLFDKEMDARWNAAKGNEVVQAIWNRSHLKSMKLAALRAVGINPHDPVIDTKDARWAIDFVRNDAHMLLAQFDTGQISSGSVDDDKQRAIAKNLVNIIQKGHAGISKSFQSRITPAMVEHGVTSLAYLSIKLRQNRVFRHPNKSEAQVINEALRDMEANGLLRVVKNDKGDPQLTSLGIPAGNAVYVVALDLERLAECMADV